ncbi:C-type lectin protein [Chytriomyces sp. MP71]|nr:C-type lectin protein [Chytriomyces sp. MP71]
MNYEHYAMHLETFLYMLIQSPNTLTPRGFKPPVHLFSATPRNISPAAPAAFLRVPIPEGVTHISTGHNDSELDDLNLSDITSHEYGWDNEHPHRLTALPANIISGRTRVQTRQVTVGEYIAFWDDAGRTNALRPASWTPKANGVKTAFGVVDVARCVNWPVYASSAQASAYAVWVGEREGKKVRLPSEVELLALRDFAGQEVEGNYGFRSWVPRDVREVAGVVGDGWELTGTVMEEHDGYEKSVIYPGYTSDFFDGKHDVVLGGSWATAPRIATRRTFRNWYQRVYPYVFAGFRLALDE